MSFWKKLGIGSAAAAAYVGRTVLIPRYQRSIQYATDEYITFAGGAILTMVSAFLLNFFLVWIGAHGMQTILALVLFPVSLYYFFAPKFSTPLLAAATANRAGAPGDQVNVWLVRDGIADLAKVYGIGVFWIEVYIVTTMVAPFDLYPAFFLFLNIFVLMLLVLLMTGKVVVSPKLYDKAFWVTLTLLLVGVLTVMVFREQLGPKWTEFTAAKTARVMAQKSELSIRNADDYTAKWIEENVFVNQKGEQLVIINGQAVPAEQAIAAAKARREQTIRSATGKTEKDGAAQGGKSSNCSYVSVCYWTNLANKWSAEWGVPLFVAGFVVVLLVLVHFIPLIWGGKKLFGKKDATTSGNLGYVPIINNPNITVVSGKPGVSLVAIILILLGLGAVFYFYATETASGYAVTRKVVGKEDRVTQEDLRNQATAKYVRARITNPDHPYYDKPLDVQVGVGITERWEMNRMVQPDESPTIIRAPNKNNYVLRQNGIDAVQNLTYGSWVNTGSGVTGTYTIAPNPATGFLTATLAANGTKIEMEFKRFFQ